MAEKEPMQQGTSSGSAAAPRAACAVAVPAGMPARAPLPPGRTKVSTRTESQVLRRIMLGFKSWQPYPRDKTEQANHGHGKSWMCQLSEAAQSSGARLRNPYGTSGKITSN